jgi:hypothetical protein
VRHPINRHSFAFSRQDLPELRFISSPSFRKEGARTVRQFRSQDLTRVLGALPVGQRKTFQMG